MPSKRIIEIPGPDFHLKLSRWDARMPSTHSRRIICLALTSGSSHENVVSYLHKGIQLTVAEIPYLAASIVPMSNEPNKLQRTVQGGGSAKLVIHDLTSEIVYSDLKSRGFPQSSLDHNLLCPFEKVTHQYSDHVDVFRVQANLVSGGVLLAISLINFISDGRGIRETIGVLARNIRQLQTMPLDLSVSTFYSVDRKALLHGSDVAGDIDRHPAWAVAYPSPPNLENRTIQYQNFRISAADLPVLKQVASINLEKGGWILTHDAIVGLIWRSIAMARRAAGVIPTDDHPTSLTQAVDTREMMNLPRPYLGNAIYAINPQLRYADIANSKNGLALAALTIRKAIQDVTPEQFQDLLSFIERTHKQTTLAVIETLDTGGIFLTSHFKFGMCDLDFGPCFARVDACLRSSAPSFPGAPHILSKMPDGSCVFLLNEQQDAMKHLLMIQDFTRFARPVEGCT